MLYPNKRLSFTIEAVLDIAYYGADMPVQSGDISKRQGIPKRYLEQSLQHLVRDGILTGLRGPRGGYKLARTPQEITLGQIVRSAMTGLVEEDEMHSGSALGINILKPVFQHIQNIMIVRLDELNLADLCKRAREAGIKREADIRLDFSI